jgi:threonyl-tRNA synthetase
MLVIGGREAEGGNVSVRHRKHGDLGVQSVEAFRARIRDLIASRATTE